MSIPIRIIRNRTISPEHYIDMETQNNIPYPLLDRYNNSNIQTNPLHQPSVADPFFNKNSERNKGFSPLCDISYIPFIDGDYCVSIFDPYVKQTTTECFSNISLQVETFNNEKQFYVTDLNPLEGTTLHILFKRNNIPESWRVDLLRNNSNNLVWKIHKTFINSEINFTGVEFELSGNEVNLRINFAGQPSGIPWEIYINETKQHFNNLSNNVETDTYTISGNASNNFLELDVNNDIGAYLLFDYTQGSNISRYRVGVVIDNGSFVLDKDVTSTDSTFPDVIGNVVGNVLEIGLDTSSGVVNGFALIPTREQFKRTDKIFFEANNIGGNIDLSLSPNAINPFDNTGSSFIVFAKSLDGSRVKIVDLNSVWTSSNISNNYIIKTSNYSNEDANIVVKKHIDSSTGIGITSSALRWDVYGYQFNFFSNEPTSTLYYNNFISTLSSEIDSIQVTGDKTIEWSFDINETFSDSTSRYSQLIHIKSGNVVYNSGLRKVFSTNRGSNLLIQSSITNSGLQITSNSPVLVSGLRTESNNLLSSSYNNLVSGKIGDIENDITIWKVYGYNNNNSFSATINYDGFGGNWFFDSKDSTFSTSDVSFSIVDNELLFNNSSTTSWNLQVYKIDSLELVDFGLKTSSSNLFTEPKSDENFSSTWVLSNKINNQDVLSTRLVVFLASDYANYPTNLNFNINNTFASSGTLQRYSTLSRTGYNQTNQNENRLYNYNLQDIGRVWNVSGFDYTKELKKISSTISDSLFNEELIPSYIFSHPHNYNLSVISTGTSNVYNIENFVEITDFPTEISIHITDIPTWVMPSSSYNIQLDEDQLLYVEHLTPSLSSATTNALFINLFESKPGSFPIGELHIDFGDGSGITKINRLGVSQESKNTKYFEDWAFFKYNQEDLRRWVYYHEFDSTLSTFEVSVTAFNIDTFTSSSNKTQIDGFEGVSTGFKRLIKTNQLTNKDHIHTIQVVGGDSGVRFERAPDNI